MNGYPYISGLFHDSSDVSEFLHVADYLCEIMQLLVHLKMLTPEVKFSVQSVVSMRHEGALCGVIK